jgi:hypothetical protein
LQAEDAVVPAVAIEQFSLDVSERSRITVDRDEHRSRHLGGLYPPSLSG